jgi:hypothetical protein
VLWEQGAGGVLLAQKNQIRLRQLGLRFFQKPWAERTWPADFQLRRHMVANPIEHAGQHGEKQLLHKPTAHRKRERTKHMGSRTEHNREGKILREEVKTDREKATPGTRDQKPTAEKYLAQKSNRRQRNTAAERETCLRQQTDT